MRGEKWGVKDQTTFSISTKWLAEKVVLKPSCAWHQVHFLRHCTTLPFHYTVLISGFPAQRDWSNSVTELWEDKGRSNSINSCLSRNKEFKRSDIFTNSALSFYKMVTNDKKQISWIYLAKINFELCQVCQRKEQIQPKCLEMQVNITNHTTF